ncbi:MAG: transporter substrate-binding domain-containing protein, partial [Richelia sp.]|nr:transporter substrate-binding domain-containing protein [Richelia sp.]
MLLGTVLCLSVTIFHQEPLQASLPGGKETLTMITSPDYPPYEYYDTQNRERKIVGFDIDIAAYIAKELKFNLQVTESDFSGLIPALQANRADFAMASMNPTPERQKNVDFSIIYHQGQNTIVVEKSTDIKQLEDLTGKTVGVQLGTIQEQRAKKVAAKIPGMQIKQLNKIPEMIQEIKGGRIDAAIIEYVPALGFV